jgi:hypothetical protein
MWGRVPHREIPRWGTCAERDDARSGPTPQGGSRRHRWESRWGLGAPGHASLPPCSSIAGRLARPLPSTAPRAVEPRRRPSSCPRLSSTRKTSKIPARILPIRNASPYCSPLPACLSCLPQRSQTVTGHVPSIHLPFQTEIREPSPEFPGRQNTCVWRSDARWRSEKVCEKWHGHPAREIPWHRRPADVALSGELKERRGGSGCVIEWSRAGIGNRCFGRVGCAVSEVSVGSVARGGEGDSLPGAGSSVRKITRARNQKRPGTSGGGRNQEGEALNRTASEGIRWWAALPGFPPTQGLPEILLTN